MGDSVNSLITMGTNRLVSSEITEDFQLTMPGDAETMNASLLSCDIECNDRSYETVVFSPAWASQPHRTIKRAVDIIGSSLLLVLLSPLLLLLAALVKLSSPGPIFYRSCLVGEGGYPFLGYKFRSMYVNADDVKSQLAHLNEMRGPVFKITRDPRITPLGRWIRKFSLDELPQLYSVLKGDMSLVGPRPPLVSEYKMFTPYQKQKMSVRPGITCLWQVNGRNEISDFDEWVRLDLRYIRTWSLWLDIGILLKTVVVVALGSGK
jgi:lipopolysaccharide/colanic/teichoic acid biosynthesis glycosyltransferase